MGIIERLRDPSASSETHETDRASLYHTRMEDRFILQEAKLRTSGRGKRRTKNKIKTSDQNKPFIVYYIIFFFNSTPCPNQKQCGNDKNMDKTNAKSSTSLCMACECLFSQPVEVFDLNTQSTHTVLNNVCTHNRSVQTAFQL